MKRNILLFLPLFGAHAFLSAQLAPPAFALPVQCEIGKSCLIQKLVDHDAGPGRQDYRCGLLTTDGHDGVDIRLRTMTDMQRGYAVLASGAGEVLRVRDGEPDISSRVRSDLGGRDAGNGVVIDHGNGWQTQYSHLRLGSVSVKPGQRVAQGQQLGLVGMSGNAEFPHLHFTVRYQGKAIDPFVGAGEIGKCDPARRGPGLWMAEAARILAYRPTAIITVGLSSSVPPKSVVDRVAPPQLSGRGDALILWVDVIGAKAGDLQEFKIMDPDGRPVHAQETGVADGGLSWFAYSGKRAPVSGWPPGRYTGQYKLRRDGVVVAQTETGGAIR